MRCGADASGPSPARMRGCLDRRAVGWPFPPCVVQPRVDCDTFGQIGARVLSAHVLSPPRACVSLSCARAASCADRVRMLRFGHVCAKIFWVERVRTLWPVRSPCAHSARCLLVLRRPNRLRPEGCSGSGQRARPAHGASLCFDARTASVRSGVLGQVNVRARRTVPPCLCFGARTVSSVRRDVPAGRPSAPRPVLP